MYFKINILQDKVRHLMVILCTSVITRFIEKFYLTYMEVTIFQYFRVEIIEIQKVVSASIIC